jgi:hypothetical protein
MLQRAHASSGGQQSTQEDVTELVYWKTDAAGEDAPPVMSPALFWMVGSQMQQLVRLDCKIEVWPEVAMLHWPQKLEHLKLHIAFDAESAEQNITSLSAMIGKSLVQHAPNLTGLNLKLIGSDGALLEHPPEFFEQISEKLQLTTLRLRGPSSAAAHLEAIPLETTKQFSRLMTGEGWLPPFKSVSLKVGCSSKPLFVTEETLPVLLKLSSLRSVLLKFTLNDPTPLIAMLSHLHTLCVSFGPRCDVDLLVAALQHGTSLTDLDINSDAFVDAHLAAVLPSMPLLERLGIDSDSVTSLLFLSCAPHLPSSLTSLTLQQCKLSPPSQVRCLQGLRALECLELRLCFTTPLDEFTRETLTPGDEGFEKDCRWPNWREMKYMPKPA